MAIRAEMGGFRCLIGRDGDHVIMRSRAGEDLTRYFPDIVEATRGIGAKQFVLDGEIVIPDKRSLSFEKLLQRIHPASSRVRKLAAEWPATFVAFDLLADEKGRALTAKTFAVRRAALEGFASRRLQAPTFVLSRSTAKITQARRWLAQAGTGCDGIVAKRLDLPYQAGTRDGMQKIKRYRSADCVVAGFRYNAQKQGGRRVVGSLLLGLYDDDGLLHHVGFSSGLKADEKPALTARLSRLAAKRSFTGRTPGGPSRWSSERASEWQPIEPRLVVEISYDYFSEERFRHGTRVLRWRPDKRAEQCGMDQLAQKTIDIRKLLV